MNCPKCGKHPLPLNTLLGTAVVCCPVCGTMVKVSVELVEAPVPVVADDADLELIVDLQKPYVYYMGYQIPTKSPHNIQPQYLFALYILAKNPNVALTTTEIWLQMDNEGLLDFTKGKAITYNQAPDAKYVRQGILGPIRKKLNSHSDVEIGQLVETLTKPSRLRLNIPPEKIKCIGLDSLLK
jgi:hypothetical protein